MQDLTGRDLYVDDGVAERVGERERWARLAGWSGEPLLGRRLYGAEKRGGGGGCCGCDEGSCC